MTNFAKLFRYPDLGQVLVTIDEGATGPQFNVSFMREGDALTHLSVAFPYADHGTREAAWAAADTALEEATNQKVHKLVTRTLEQVTGE